MTDIPGFDADGLRKKLFRHDNMLLYTDTIVLSRSKLMATITAAVEDAVRRARIAELETMKQRYLNHSERYYDSDGEDALVVRCGQINHEAAKRMKTLTAQADRQKGTNND